MGDDASEQLRRELDTRLSELEKRLTQHIQLNEQAVSLAREAMEKRLDGMNEFRQQLRDQSGHFATREQVELLISNVQAAVGSERERIHKVETDMANWRGRFSQTVWLLGLFFVVVQVMLRLLWTK